MWRLEKINWCFGKAVDHKYIYIKYIYICTDIFTELLKIIFKI